jgi:hypothetical protein
MSLKTIQMDPTHLKISKQKKSKKVIVPPSVMVNQPNLRQILLNKLLKHRKTQKNDPQILNNTFDSQCSMDLTSPSVSVASVSAPSLCAPSVSVAIPATVLTTVPVTISEGVSASPDKPYGQDKPYGVLKNGIKPTYKQWNLSQKNLDRSELNPNDPIPVSLQKEPVKEHNNESEKDHKKEHENESKEMIQVEKEYKKPVIVGKNKKNKTVHVLIPCHKTRKLRSDQGELYKKTNLTTVKNYLKQHKLMKVGSTAPTNLIREIYENAKCFGDVINTNKHNLLHNFEKDD